VSNASGVSGPFGAVLDRFDQIPVRGKLMTTLVSVIALVALAATNAHAIHLVGKPDCAKNDGLTDVYKPQRFKVLAVCVGPVQGTVVAYRHEHDGDWHVSMSIDGRGGWTNDLNAKRQHGYTVVEFVPTLSRPKFRAGMRLSLTGTKVLDLQHGDHKTTGWVEMHPVFEWKDIGDQPGDQVNVPKLAPPTEEVKRRGDLRVKRCYAFGPDCDGRVVAPGPPSGEATAHP
jgi:hypothetical protein